MNVVDLCNARALLQKCKMVTFSDQFERIMKGFMDDFSVLGKDYLENSDKVLKNRQETHFDLNWKKCLFMVREKVVLGH